MELGKLKKAISEFISKYRYVILVLVIGLVLMIVPTTSAKNREPPAPDAKNSTEDCFENKLAEILSHITGAGEVKVLLTVAAGEEMRYQTNDRIDNGETASNINYDTVTVTDADRNQNGLVRQVIPATYKGVIIVCQGADDPVVRLSIIDAVSKLTGLGSNKISVLKMK